MSNAPFGGLSPSTLAGLALLGSLPAVRRHAPLPPSNGDAGRPQIPLGDKADISPGNIRGLVNGSIQLRPKLDHSDTWSERAAIIEHEGGHPRAVAERLATLLLLMDETDGASPEWRALDRELVLLDRRR